MPGVRSARDDRLGHARAAVLAGHPRLRMDGVAAALPAGDLVSDPRTSGRRDSVGGPVRTCHVSLRVRDAEVLPDHDAEGGGPVATHLYLDPFGSFASEHYPHPGRPSDSGIENPRHRRDLILQGTQICHVGLRPGSLLRGMGRTGKRARNHRWTQLLFRQ